MFVRTDLPCPFAKHMFSIDFIITSGICIDACVCWIHLFYFLFCSLKNIYFSCRTKLLSIFSAVFSLSLAIFGSDDISFFRFASICVLFPRNVCICFYHLRSNLIRRHDGHFLSMSKYDVHSLRYPIRSRFQFNFFRLFGFFPSFPFEILFFRCGYDDALLDD